MNKEETIQLLEQQIRKLKKERDNTPNQNIQNSITDDIRYYQNQIDSLMDSWQTDTPITHKNANNENQLEMASNQNE